MCDGKNTLQEMASAACAKGLTTLGFTGHSYTQRDREYCMSPSRTAQYKATIAKLKTEYKGKVDILCGIEWDCIAFWNTKRLALSSVFFRNVSSSPGRHLEAYCS